MISPEGTISPWASDVHDSHNLIQFLRNHKEIVGMEIYPQELNWYFLDFCFTRVKEFEIACHFIHCQVESRSVIWSLFNVSPFVGAFPQALTDSGVFHHIFYLFELFLKHVLLEKLKATFKPIISRLNSRYEWIFFVKVFSLLTRFHYLFA